MDNNIEINLYGSITKNNKYMGLSYEEILKIIKKLKKENKIIEIKDFKNFNKLDYKIIFNTEISKKLNDEINNLKNEKRSAISPIEKSNIKKEIYYKYENYLNELLKKIFLKYTNSNNKIIFEFNTFKNKFYIRINN